MNTYFKGSVSCIDLILTNWKYTFKDTTPKPGIVITTKWFLLYFKLLFKRKEIISTLCLKISKVIFRKSYRAARAHIKDLTTISHPALISMLQKRKRYFGEMKSLIWTKIWGVPSWKGWRARVKLKKLKILLI